MFKRIDEDLEDIDGFSYEGLGGIESVTVPEGSTDRQYVTIKDSEGDQIVVYHQDIPKLIKALQASYNFKN